LAHVNNAARQKHGRVFGRREDVKIWMKNARYPSGTHARVSEKFWKFSRRGAGESRRGACRNYRADRVRGQRRGKDHHYSQKKFELFPRLTESCSQSDKNRRTCLKRFQNLAQLTFFESDIIRTNNN
jgi:hypothetical protein